MTGTVKRWQADPDFVDWLVSMQYAKRMDSGKITHHFNGDGIVIYMWEAWRAAITAALKPEDQGVATPEPTSGANKMVAANLARRIQLAFPVLSGRAAELEVLCAEALAEMEPAND